MNAGGIRLVQKRQLRGLSNHLPGCLSDEVFQRPGKVRLVEIASQMNSVEYRDALF